VGAKIFYVYVKRGMVKITVTIKMTNYTWWNLQLPTKLWLPRLVLTITYKNYSLS